MSGRLFPLRAADVLNIGFLLLLAAVTAFFRSRVDGTGILLGIYLGLAGGQVVLSAVSDGGGRALRFFYDLVFPAFSILVVFDSLGRIVHAVNPRDIDALLIRLDYLLFGTYPTVALERITIPPLTDLFQTAYCSYYFLPIILGIVLLRQRHPSFDRALFSIMLCFYLSYMGYLLLPAIGPRFTMNHLQSLDLKGWFVAGGLQELLNRLEGVKRDAFPSGHTGVALTVLYLAFRLERRLFWCYLPFVALLIFSTVYCRYHYVVDVIAGVLLAVVTVALGEWLYGYGTAGNDYHR